VRRRYDFAMSITPRHDSDSEKEEDEAPNKAQEKKEIEKMKDSMNNALGIKDNIGKKSLLEESLANKEQEEDSDDAAVIRKSEFIPAAGLVSVAQFKLEVKVEVMV
jgi:hypothetical protein